MPTNVPYAEIDLTIPKFSESAFSSAAPSTASSQEATRLHARVLRRAFSRINAVVTATLSQRICSEREARSERSRSGGGRRPAGLRIPVTSRPPETGGSCPVTPRYREETRRSFLSRYILWSVLPGLQVFDSSGSTFFFEKTASCIIIECRA